MSKAKQNTFLIGFFSILAVGAAGLGYLAWSSSSSLAESRDNYESAQTKLNALQKAPIFPKPENVEAKKQQVAAYNAKVEELSSTLTKFQTPLVDNMSSSEFQSKLQKLRDELVNDAKNAGVTLPDNFDLGMGAYLSTFPETAAVPRLNAWLEGIHHFVKVLILNGVKEINVVSRPTLPWETKPAAAPVVDPKAKPVKTPPKPATSAKDKGKAAAPAPPLLEESAVLERFPFAVTFTGSNRALNQVMTAVAAAGPDVPFFYNIRTLRIENEQKNGAETSAVISVQEQTDPVTQKPFKRDSVFIFGRERVKAHFEMDLIRFGGAPTAAASK